MKSDDDIDGQVLFKVCDGYASLSAHEFKQGSIGGRALTDGRTADSLAKMQLAQSLAQSRRNQAQSEVLKNG